VQAPNLLNLTVVHSDFETKRLMWVGFELVQEPNQFIEIVSDGHDLTTQNPDEFPNERGLYIISCLFVDLPGKLAVEFRDDERS